VARQVHAVMQDAQDVDLVLSLVGPENNQMPSGASLSGHMQGVNSFVHVKAWFAADDRRATTKVTQRCAQGLGVNPGLVLAKLLQCPAQYADVISIGMGTFSDQPGFVVHASPKTSAVMASKSAASASSDSKVW